MTMRPSPGVNECLPDRPWAGVPPIRTGASSTALHRRYTLTGNSDELSTGCGGMRMGKVRIALTISGAVSLGAFEGGALAALIAGVQGTQVHNHDREDPDLRIDAIGGSSAGAITAVMAARAVTAGLDPIEMLRGAWVDDVSLPLLLRGAGAHAPLTMNGLR